MKQHIYCVPVDEKVTRMMLSSTRDFGLFALLASLYWLLDWSNVWILREDRAVVESSQPPRGAAPEREKSVALDGPTLAFRRWYRRELKPRASQKVDVPATSLRKGVRAS
jgi:hypothetical protein